MSARPRTWTYLFTATGCVLLLAIASFTVVSLLALNGTAYRQTEDNLRQFCHSIAHYLDSEGASRDTESLQRFCDRFAAEPNLRVTYIGADGSVLADSSANLSTLENHKDRPEVASALAGAERGSERFSASLGKKMVYYAIPFHGDAIRLAVSVDYVENASRRTAAILILAAVLILLAAIAVSLLAARSIVVPLQTLERAARSYSEGRLDTEVARKNFPLEFSELADTFSLMAAKLREKIDALDGQNRETGAILASMNDALVMIDESGTVVRVNKAAEGLFCISGADAAGLPLIQAVRNTDIVDFALTPERDETERAIELRAVGPDGSRFVLAKASRIEGSAGRLLVLSDITRLKRLERIRKDFVANVSHELKTPVTSIQGFIETLKDGAIGDPATARRFLGIMEQQSSRLGAIIDDLLAISRLEQGEGGDRAAILREPSRIETLLTNVKNLCQEEAERKETTLTFVCPASLECEVNPGLIEQAITNLVLNAIKYSPERSAVKVSADVCGPEADGTRRLVCVVSDNGIGIPEKDLSRIFERFYRVDKGRSRAMGGTGLGLAIVRHIALAHGGSVTVQSVEGEGSSFRLDIPV